MNNYFLLIWENFLNNICKMICLSISSGYQFLKVNLYEEIYCDKNFNGLPWQQMSALPTPGISVMFW